MTADSKSAEILQAAVPPAREIRQELIDLFVRDILGPAGGANEEVAEDRIQERYLVGLLAPQRQRVNPEQIDEVATGGKDSGEDGLAEPSAAQVSTMFPSSFGLTFSVDEQCTAIQVTVRWGQYERTESSAGGAGGTTGDGNPQRVWRRTQIDARLEALPLTEGKLNPRAPHEDHPEVFVQGVIRGVRDGCRIITLFLVNGQKEPERLRGAAWLFQPELMVEATDATPIFRRHLLPARGDRKNSARFAEEQSMEMLHRRQLEFAVGHGVGVHWDVDPLNSERARLVRTAIIPLHELPRTEPPTVQEVPELAGVELDMKVLGAAPRERLAGMLAGLTHAYSAWIEVQRRRLTDEPDLAAFKKYGKTALDHCATARDRIQAGIDLLESDANAAEAFQFMNRAMALQRVRGLHSERIRRASESRMESRIEELDRPENHRWYPFQLAFILLNLPGITQFHHRDRGEDAAAVADLLWFPTGGGKTEAYLGLTAYTIALRRLQGTIEGRSGEDGVAVLMRYTLRVLTLQQFQRAATLICACEVVRREAAAKADHRLGRTPFRIGIWVGKKTTPNFT